jgi:hypothetical protein
MAEKKQLVIELPTQIADLLDQKAAEAKLPLQAIVIGQLFQWLGNHQIGYIPRARWAKAGIPDHGVAIGAGALAAEAAELEAERHLEEQGIMICSMEQDGGTLCVPKEMLPAEIVQKLDAESLTKTGPGWKVSTDKKFQSGEPHPSPCNHHPDRLHYMLLQGKPGQL